MKNGKSRRRFIQNMSGFGLLGLVGAGTIFGSNYLKSAPVRVRPSRGQYPERGVFRTSWPIKVWTSVLPRSCPNNGLP